LALASCGSSDSAPPPIGPEAEAGVDAVVTEAGPGDDGSGSDAAQPNDVVTPPRCESVLAMHEDEGAQHVPSCSPVIYRTNPLSSGNHYNFWATYKIYSSPFLPGFWVHSMEHGGVVITYNCPAGCDDELALAKAFVEALPGDPGCGMARMRVILVPYPDLDVRFAVSAWRYTLKSDCFDPGAVSAFVTAHHGKGGNEPTLCDNGIGIDPLTGAPGGLAACP
jgi:hypothetical protein